MSTRRTKEAPAEQGYGQPGCKGLTELSDIAHLETITHSPKASLTLVPSVSNSHVSTVRADRLVQGRSARTASALKHESVAKGSVTLTPRHAAPHLRGAPSERQAALLGELNLDSIPGGASLQTHHSAPALPIFEPPSTSARESSSTKAAHKPARPFRRGPMDEMRQLIRILGKMMPCSQPNLVTKCEDGGGNRISEEQIKKYLSATLGEAPQPEWGLPNGWCRYLADLFAWASGYIISEEDARQCAKRDTGRPWEAVWPKLHSLNLYPDRWPLPLMQQDVRAVQDNLQAAPSAAAAATKSGRARHAQDAQGDGDGPQTKRSRLTSPPPEPSLALSAAAAPALPAAGPPAHTAIGQQPAAAPQPTIPAFLDTLSEQDMRCLLVSLPSCLARMAPPSTFEAGVLHGQAAQALQTALHMVTSAAGNGTGGYLAGYIPPAPSLGQAAQLSGLWGGTDALVGRALSAPAAPLRAQLQSDWEPTQDDVPLQLCISRSGLMAALGLTGAADPHSALTGFGSPRPQEGRCTQAPGPLGTPLSQAPRAQCDADDSLQQARDSLTGGGDGGSCRAAAEGAVGSVKTGLRDHPAGQGGGLSDGVSASASAGTHAPAGDSQAQIDAAALFLGASQNTLAALLQDSQEESQPFATQTYMNLSQDQGAMLPLSQQVFAARFGGATDSQVLPLSTPSQMLEEKAVQALQSPKADTLTPSQVLM